MTIPFEKLKARLLANPKVKAEYDALAPEFEISAELVKARLRAEHQNLVALRPSNGQQVPRAAFGGLMRHLPTAGDDIAQNRHRRATVDEDGQNSIAEALLRHKGFSNINRNRLI
jgi:predicted protein tyrosine phosphatase